MTINVSYSRGNGGISLTAAQLAQLQTLFDAQLALYQGNQSQLGLGTPLYELILSFISDTEVTTLIDEAGFPYDVTTRVPKPGVDPTVWRWIDGATKVNSGEGFFADFIREYTKIQFQIRGGDPAQAEVLNQVASNNIAFNLVRDIFAHGGGLPGIGGLGAIDAGAAASTVFVGLPRAPSGDYAPWAGTLLFPYLGFDPFFSDLLLNDEQVSATIEGEGTKIIKHTEGTYDLIAAISAARTASTRAGLDSFGNFLEAVRNLFGPDVPDSNQDNLMAAADNFFWRHYGLTEDDGFEPGNDLVFNSALSQLGERYTVGTYGDDASIDGTIFADIIHAGRGDDVVNGSPGGDLIDGGEGVDTVDYSGLSNELTLTLNTDLSANAAHDYRLELEGLISTDLLYDVERVKLGSDDDTLTIDKLEGEALEGLEWIDMSGNSSKTGDTLDLSQMTEAVNVVRQGDSGVTVAVQSDQSFTLEVRNAETIKGTQYDDHIEGGGGENYLHGGAGNDDLYADGANSRTETGKNYLLGGAGDDNLYGAAGRDLMTGGADADRMEGGNGDDLYNADAADTIMDEDGKGSVYLDRRRLTGGTRKEEDPENEYRNGSTVYVLNGTTLTINGGLTINSFTNGDLGIFLEEEDDEDGPDMDEPESRASPLVIDLDGDGVETAAYSRDRYFDHDANGMQESTAWAGSDDGLLVRDVDGNGRIDTGRELFGSNTRLASGALAENGFAALAELDSNGDGIVNASDQDFAQLRIWRDANGNGISEAGELLTLEQAGLQGLRTGWAVSNHVDANGQAHRQMGFAIRADGSSANVSDVWFTSDSSRRINNVDVPIEALFELEGTPNAKAFGNLADLHQVIVSNAAVKPLLDAYLSETDPAARKTKLEALIFEWAGVTSVDPASRGPYIDARKMAVVELIVGRPYRNEYTPNDPNPRWEASNLLLAEFAEFEQYVAAQFAAQVDYDATGIFEAGFASGYSRVRVDWQVLIQHVGVLRANGDMEGIAALWETLRALSVYSPTFQQEMSGVLPTLVALYPDVEPVLSGAKFVTGTEAAETLYGSSADEIIRAAAGNDTLYGQSGNDSYVYRPGDGHDVIFDSRGNDQLVLAAGILPAHLSITRDVSAIRIDINNGTSTGSIRISNVFEGTQGALREGVIEAIRFEDGTLWNLDRILSEIRQPSTPGNDAMYGSAVNETFASGEGDDQLFGYGGDDHLSGEAGADVLEGGDGNDQLFGGTGNDHLEGGIGNDILQGDAGADTLRGGDGVDQLSGGDDNDFLDGGNDNDVLQGAAGADTLHGGDGDDQLVGGLGDDRMEGGAGDDRYYHARGDGTDTIYDSSGHSTIYVSNLPLSEVYFRRDGTSLVIRFTSSADDEIRLERYFNPTTGLALSGIRVDQGDGAPWEITPEALDLEVLKATSAADVILGNRLDNVVEALAGNDTVRGHDGNDQLAGGDGDDQLYGDAGNDILSGGADVDLLDGGTGDDQLDGGAGDDTLSGGEGTDTLLGGLGADALSGGVGVDQLDGGAGNDTLDGGAGADQLTGRSGDDIYLVDDVGDVVTELANEGADVIRSSVSYTIAANVESLELVGTGNVDATGNAVANRLVGNEANNRLDGLDGDDVLEGGDGEDQLLGGAGEDQLDGGTGQDHLTGGAGDDVYIVDQEADVILELAGEGSDEVIAHSSYTLSDHIESLTLAEGYGAYSGTGNVRDNLITGNSSSNRLDGAAGADRMVGGEGNDTYVVDNASDEVVELAGEGSDTVESSIDYVLGATLENLVLTGSLDLQGIGNDGDNVLVGNEGNNRLDGGSGGDDMYGGAGNDYFINDSSGDWIYEYSDEGIDTVERRYETNLVLSNNVEHLILAAGITTGNGNALDNVITGNAGANTLGGWDGDDEIYGLEGDDALFGGTGTDLLLGGTGQDYLDGGAGVDRLEGGAGDDTYVVDHSSDVVVETDAVGEDRVQSTASYTLSSNVEILFLQGSAAIDGTGNSLDNYIAGNGAANTLRGEAGSDTLVGGGGGDTLIGGAGDDKYVYALGDGSDTIDNTGGGYDGVFFTGGIGESRLSFSRDGNDLLILVDGDAAQSVRVLGHFLGGDRAIGYVQPEGGFSISAARIGHIVAAQGVPGNFETLIDGTSAGEELAGYAGRDLLRGQGGDDDLFGMGGDDQLEGGDGADYLSGGNGSQTGSGNDVLIGGNGDDILVGEDGNDTLLGGAGDDDYYYRIGSGVDVIDNTGGGFDGAFFIDIVRSRLSFSRSGNDLVITVDQDSAKQLRVTNHFLGGDYALDYLQPQDGSYLTTAQINQLVSGSEYDQVIEGTAAGEELIGGTGKDLIKGLGGDDDLFGMAGNDTLQGGDGADYLAGGNGGGTNSGADRLEGGAGNDTLLGEDGANALFGGAGDDNYVHGTGQDTIDNTGGGVDGVFFGAGIAVGNLAFTRTGDDLVITVNGSATDTVRVTNHFLGGDYALDFVQPGSGNLLDTNAINALVAGTGNPGNGGNQGNDADYPNVVTGTAAGEDLYGSNGRDLIRGLGGGDTLFGFGADDKFDGGDGDDYISGGDGSFAGSGNDILIGGAGDDTLVGEDGNDTLFGGAGSDDYYYAAGSGSDIIDNVGGGTDVVFFLSIDRARLGFHRVGNDLIIRVDANANQQVRVLDHFLGGERAISYVQPGSGFAIAASQIPALLTPLPAGASAMATESGTGVEYDIAADTRAELNGLIAAMASFEPAESSITEWRAPRPVHYELAVAP